MSESLLSCIPDSLSADGREIAAQLVRGLDDLAKKTARLGTLLASMSDEDRALFIDGFPSHYQTIWRNLLKVGRGELHPRLATASGRAAQVLRKLPYAEQEQFTIELIPVVTGPDRRSVKYFDIENMPAEMIPQVFAQGGGRARVRTLDEQRQWRARNEAKQQAAAEKAAHTEISRPGKWAIRNGRAYIAAKVAERGLTLEDVERIRADLKL